MGRLAFAFLLPLWFLFLGPKGAAAAGPSPVLLGQGWQEAVIAVDDIERAEAFYTDVAGWEVIHRGTDDKSYASEAPAAIVVMAAPGADRGRVRLIERAVEGQRPARANAQAWDTGGIFSLMTRTGSVKSVLERAEALGYTAFNEPYPLAFGDLSLLNIVIRGPGGGNLAAYEWVSPQRDDVDADSVTAPFNSMQMVADLEGAKTFYVGGLGMEVIAEGTFVDSFDQPTNFALPVNFATKVLRDYVILKEAGADGLGGRIELMHFRGLVGRDLSKGSTPEALGLIGLRWPVANLTAWRKKVEDMGAPIFAETEEANWPPYGTVQAFTTASPEGAPITFFQLKDDNND